MPRPLRSAHARSLLLLVWLVCLPGAARLGLNGQMLRSTSLTFDDAELGRLESIEPHVRRIASGVQLQSITYSSDGLRVHGYLARPRGDDAPLPCVIYNRGGNQRFGTLGDAEALLALGPIALEGYVVVASQYRGSRGSEGRDEFGGADVNDVLNLIPLLESLPDADASRIGMIGWSRGGMMTYLALARTDRVSAAVVGAGAADLGEAARRRPELDRVFRELIPDYDTASQEKLAARSAVNWPDRLNKETPILVLQGGADWRVDPRQSLVLAEKLLDARHPFRLVFFEGGDHGLTEYRSEVQGLVGDWFHRYVRDGESWPSLAPHGS